MPQREEYERNKVSYLRLKETIRNTYPHGWFVGIADDQIVGAAADFRSLETSLREQGTDPRGVLVVEAGVDYPQYVTILDTGSFHQITSGGCFPTTDRARRRLTRAAQFRCSASTVARPVAVRPSITMKSLFQSKWRDHR
jgi:hypothetical protein